MRVIYLTHDETTLAILRTSEKASTQQSMADEIGFSIGKINYILKALVDKGLIKAEKFLTSDNKTKYKYLLTEKGIQEKMQLTKKFITTKKAEYEELQKELEADMLNLGKIK